MPLCAVDGIPNPGRTAELTLIVLQGLHAVVFKLALDPLGFSEIISRVR